MEALKSVIHGVEEEIERVYVLDVERSGSNARLVEEEAPILLE